MENIDYLLESSQLPTLQELGPITVPISQMRRQVHGGQVPQPSLNHCNSQRLSWEVSNYYYLLSTSFLQHFIYRISFILSSDLEKQV